jgi:hypothetical protein
MVDGILGGLGNFAGGVGDFFTGGGVYADPKNINQRYGVPEADVRQAGLGALGNVGALLLAAGQSPDRGQRAQFLGQLGGAVSGMNTDIFKSSQARLMTAQQQQAMREIEETNALGAEIQRLGPEGFKAQYRIDPRGIGLKDLRQALTQMRVSEATMTPADRAKAAARERASSYLVPTQAQPTAGPAPQEVAGQPPAQGVDVSVELARTIASDPTILAGDPALARQYAEIAEKLQSPGAKQTEILRAKSDFEKLQGLPRVESAFANREVKTNLVRNTIKEAIPEVGVTTAGLGGSVMGRVSGTAAVDLQKKIDTIKANIGFDELQNMRDSSPTGGALGQVAVQELNFLQATLGSLDREQSPAELRKRLEQIDGVLKRYQESRREAFKKDYGRYPTPAEQPEAAPPTGVSGVDKQALDWANSNPNDPRSAAIKQRLGVR